MHWLSSARGSKGQQVGFLLSSLLSGCWPHFPPCCDPLLLGWKHRSSRCFSQPNCYSCPHLLLPAKAGSWPETKDVEELGAQIPKGQYIGPASQAPAGVWMGPSLGLEAQTPDSCLQSTAAPEAEHSTHVLASSFMQPLFVRHLVARLALRRPEAQGCFANVSCGHHAWGP